MTRRHIWTRMAAVGVWTTAGYILISPAGGAAANEVAHAEAAESSMAVARRAADGKRLAVPPEHARAGVVFHVAEHVETAATVVSKTALETFTGRTTAIPGYLVIDTARRQPDGPPLVVHGGFRVAAGSITTGIALRDEHMLSEPWLDAEQHPDVTLAIRSVQGLEMASSDDAAGVRVWTGTINAEATIRGITRPVTITNAELRELHAGRVVALRAGVTLTLRDFGMESTTIGVIVGETVRVEATLVLEK